MGVLTCGRAGAGFAVRREDLWRDDEPLVKPVALDPLWLLRSATCAEDPA